MKKLLLVVTIVSMLMSTATSVAYLSDGTFGIENIPNDIVEIIDGSRWRKWEVTGWVNPSGLRKNSACAFAVVKRGRENVLLAFGWDNGWKYKWFNPAALPQVYEPIMLVDTSIDLQREKGFNIGFISFYSVNGESAEKSCIWGLESDGAWRLYHLTSIEPFMMFDTSKDNAIRLYDVGWVDGEETDVWVYGSYQKNLRFFSLREFPMSVKQAQEALSNPPSIPTGNLTAQKIQFSGGLKYKVYQGPGEEYGQAGKGKAVVSTNDWIQVFGEENGWIFIQYDITSDHMRMGWIEASALPKKASVNELFYSPISAITTHNTNLTDDPLFSQSGISVLPISTQVGDNGPVGLCGGY